MRIEALRKRTDREEVDYQFLLSALSDYARPRDKISTWLKLGELIRVKKGLYIFGEKVALIPYSKEVLANLIYGPSVISLNYALAFYGMIPERVTTVTSITNKRNKSFSTPVGEFSYQYLNPTKFPIGVELINANWKNNFLIASPEKALCDYIHLTDKKINLNQFDTIETYLFHDLRIDEDALQQLHATKLMEICAGYNDPRLNILTQYIKKWKQ